MIGDLGPVREETPGSLPIERSRREPLDRGQVLGNVLPSRQGEVAPACGIPPHPNPRASGSAQSLKESMGAEWRLRQKNRKAVEEQNKE